MFNTEVLDLNLRSKTSMGNIRYWTTRPTGGMDQLELEFNKYQCDPAIAAIIKIEDDKKEKRRLQREKEERQNESRKDFKKEIKPERIDSLWHKIGEMRSDGGELRYANLATFMKALCVLPHSNADSERVFSIIRKNKTESRASMTRELMNDLTVVKMHMIARNQVCRSTKYPSAFLTKVKHLSQV